MVGKDKKIGSQLWRQALITSEATVQQAIQNLDESAMQIALVVSTSGVLLGTITDGDIRRGLLRGLDLTSPVISIVKREPTVVPPEMDRDTVLKLMQANVFNAIPVIDEKRQVVGLHLLNELLVPQDLPNLMIIMAGGQGTRLRPHTENCPKPLLPVGDKPILEHIIERAKEEGFKNFIFAINYLGHMIEEYFGDGSRWNISINYLREEIPLGTAGALALLKPRPDAPFLVSNGDILTDIRYAELLDFHCRHGAAATMAVRQYEWQHPYGVVRTNGVDIVDFEEKPITRSHVNAGVYVLEPDTLNNLCIGEHSDMPVLFSRLQEISKRTIVYPIHEPWLDVGRPDDFKMAQNEYRTDDNLQRKK